MTQSHTTDGDRSARLRRELERQHRERLELVSSLEATFGQVVASSRDSNADDEHDPEGATIAFERAQLDAMLHQTRRQLAEITAALQRLDGGTYGRCEICTKPIAPGRLEARPTARVCVGCASTS